MPDDQAVHGWATASLSHSIARLLWSGFAFWQGAQAVVLTTEPGSYGDVALVGAGHLCLTGVAVAAAVRRVPDIVVILLGYAMAMWEWTQLSTLDNPSTLAW